MRWFLIIVCFAIAVAAGTAPLWWEALGGTQPQRLSLFATLISAVAGVLGVVLGVMGYSAKGKGNGEPQPLKQTVQGSIFKGKVSAGGDIVGGDKITGPQGNSKKRS